MRRRGSKYGNLITEVDGIKFHSAAEARRYQELRLLERAGEITDLNLQPSFELSVDNGWYLEFDAEGDHDRCSRSATLGKYIADFSYKDKGVWTYEDVKGVRTPLYKWKKKHVEAQYGITIREVRMR